MVLEHSLQVVLSSTLIPYTSLFAGVKWGYTYVFVSLTASRESDIDDVPFLP